MTPEAKVTAACLRYLKKLKDDGVPIHWFKITGGPRQTVGHPDLLICMAGWMIADELKAPGKDATPLQLHRLNQWAAAGATTGVIHSVEELAAQIEPMMRKVSPVNNHPPPPGVPAAAASKDVEKRQQAGGGL